MTKTIINTASRKVVDVVADDTVQETDYPFRPPYYEELDGEYEIGTIAPTE